MANNYKGTVVAAKLVPSSSADTYATHDEQFGIGGYRSVSKTADMLAIPEGRMRKGMLVYVDTEKTTYRLITDAPTHEMSDWEVVAEYEAQTKYVSPKWWTDEYTKFKDEEQRSDSKLTTGVTYYVPEYDTSGTVEYYVYETAPTSIVEVKRANRDENNGWYTEDDAGTYYLSTAEPSAYSGNNIDVIYTTIIYTHQWVYSSPSWIDLSTQANTNYELDDRLQVIYSSAYTGYQNALKFVEDNLNESRTDDDSSKTSDDMHNMKKALDVLYAYLFPPEYMDWKLDVDLTEGNKTETFYAYHKTNSEINNIPSYKVTVKAENPQKDVEYKITSFDYQRDNGEISSITIPSEITTSISSAVTFNATQIVGSAASRFVTVGDKFYVSGFCTDTSAPSAKAGRTVSSTTTGSSTVESTLRTKHNTDTQVQTSSTTVDVNIVNVYKYPDNWEYASGPSFTQQPAYVGHPNKSTLSFTLKENTLPSSVIVSGKTVDLPSSDANKSFTNANTVTVSCNNSSPSGYSSATTVEYNFVQQPSTAGTSSENGPNINNAKVASTPYSLKTFRWSVDSDTDIVDIAGNKPQNITGSTNQNFTPRYSEVSSFTPSYELYAKINDGVVNNVTTLSAYCGTDLTFSAKTTVPPNYKFDCLLPNVTDNVDYNGEDDDVYKLKWFAAFNYGLSGSASFNGSGIDLTINKGTNSYTLDLMNITTTAAISSITYHSEEAKDLTLNITMGVDSSKVSDIKGLVPSPFSNNIPVTIIRPDMKLILFQDGKTIDTAITEPKIVTADPTAGTNEIKCKGVIDLTYDNGTYKVNSIDTTNYAFYLMSNKELSKILIGYNGMFDPITIDDKSKESSIIGAGVLDDVLGHQQKYDLGGYYLYFLTDSATLPDFQIQINK